MQSGKMIRQLDVVVAGGDVHSVFAETLPGGLLGGRFHWPLCLPTLQIPGEPVPRVLQCLHPPARHSEPLYFREW